MLNNDIPLFGAEDSLPKFVSFAQKKMPLGLGEENHNSPIWLGDGKTIAFGIRWLSKSSGTEDAIYLINVDGTNLREFLIGAHTHYWSNDGKKLVFEGLHLSASIINIDGTNLCELKDLMTDKGVLKPSPRVGFRGDFRFSPDGNKLATVINVSVDKKQASHQGAYIGQMEDVIERQIWIFDLTSKSAGKLIAGFNPVWSPDGKRIAFRAENNVANQPKPKWEEYDKSELCLIDTDGKNLRNFGAATDGGQRIAWSPDGKMIYYETKGNIWPNIWVINLLNKEKRCLTSINKQPEYDNQGGEGFILSPNGKEIVFAREGDIWKLNLTSIENGLPRKTQLTNSPDLQWTNPGCWSPDGRKIVFPRRCEIRIMNSDGSGQKKLTFLKND